MIISGKELSAKLKAEMAVQVAGFPEKYGRVPHLVVILVGEDPGSVSYVTGKAKASEIVGIRNTTIRKPDTISEEELLDLIRELNADDMVDGIWSSSRFQSTSAKTRSSQRLQRKRTWTDFIPSM